jgi:hypothetical protein
MDRAEGSTDTAYTYDELLQAQTVLLRAIWHLQSTKPYSLYVTRFDAMNILTERVKELDNDLRNVSEVR